MNFLRESGAIIGQSRQLLHVVEGSASEVIFPQETAWNLHKSFLGVIYAFSHIHPDGMTMLSHEDETTLRAWALAIAPFPMRMITITLMRTDKGLSHITQDEYVFRETCYIGLLEAKETWLLHKEQKRKFGVIKEWDRDFIILDPTRAMNDWYGLVLIRKSYQWDSVGVN